MSAAEGLTQRTSNRDDGTQVLPPDETDQKYMEKSYRKKAAEVVKKPGVQSLLIAVGIPLIAGIADGLVNSPSGAWYKQLDKPWWNPPGFLFGAAWSVLYPVMGLASWLVWADGGFQKQGYPLALYAAQLLLNLAWPALFFGAHSIGLALVDIIILAILVALTVAAFQRVNHVAGHLLKPYLAWVIFATALTISFYIKNHGYTGASDQEEHTEE
jgi:tryptophan-rich sensory protein